MKCSRISCKSGLRPVWVKDGYDSDRRYCVICKRKIDDAYRRPGMSLFVRSELPEEIEQTTEEI